jgi:hypothetical protein
LLPTHDANTQHEARNPSRTRATCTNGAVKKRQGEERERREEERDKGKKEGDSSK